MPLIIVTSLGARLAVRPPQVLSVSVVWHVLLISVRAHENTNLLNSWLFTVIYLWSWHLQVGLAPVFPSLDSRPFCSIAFWPTVRLLGSLIIVILSSFSFLASLGFLCSAWALRQNQLLCGMWNLSSPPGNWTHIPCTGRWDSSPLHRQEVPDTFPLYKWLDYA